MIRMIHGADFHLDSPFEVLPPEQAAERRKELRQIPRRLAQLAEKFQPDLVLLSGDLLDSRRVYTETVEELARSLGEIRAPVFIAPGNHDPFRADSPYVREPWPENVHIFSSSVIQSVDLPQCGAVVYGAAFPAAHQEESLLAGFTAPRDDRLHLMTLHAQVDGGEGCPYNPITTQEIADSGLDYLALGHIHSHTEGLRAGDVPWAYSGCPEGRGFDECGPRGVLCLQLEKGREPEAQFVALCSRQYLSCTVAVTPEMNEDAIAQRIRAQASPTDLIRVTLTGETGDKGIHLSQIEQLCQGAFYSLQISDQTRPALDLWDRLGEDSLTGLFLQKLREMQTGGEPDPAVQLAARYGLAALENREEIQS